MFDPNRTTVAERDRELGRWRWPEDPNIVVYPRDGGGWVEVMHEVHASRGVYSRGDFNSVPEWVEDAAEDYFAAHPEPKPWHDAEPGEAWVLTYEGREYAAVVDDDYDVLLGGMYRHILTSDGITAGRRIWPVDDA